MSNATHLSKKRKLSPSSRLSEKKNEEKRIKVSIVSTPSKPRRLKKVKTLLQKQDIHNNECGPTDQTVIETADSNIGLVPHHHHHHTLVPQTTDRLEKTDTAPLVKRIGGLKLSASAKKALKGGRIVATVLKNYPEKIMYNHLEEFAFHGERLYRENNMSKLLTMVPNIKETDIQILFVEARPSVLLLSFLLSPEKWLEKTSGTAQDSHIIIKDPQNNVGKNIVKTNTRSVDHDTGFPALEGGCESGMACVIVGCEKELQDIFSAELEYGHTCDKIITSINGGGSETTTPVAGGGAAVKVTGGRKSGFCTANNFAVLVGLEYQRMVPDDGDTMKTVDFFQQTKDCSQTQEALVPLLLTSCCEAVQRVQMQYVQLLYDMGAVRLHPEPIDSSKILYRLSHTDEASLKMQLRTSKVLLYSVMVWCQLCRVQQNHHWTPNVESEKNPNNTQWLDSCRCLVCGGQLTNDSCFVMNGGSSKHKRDPATVRGIHYEVAKIDGKDQLPEGVSRRDQLPQNEHVRPEVNAKSLQICLRQDYERKIQKHPSVSLTLFVPVCFNEKATVKRLEKKFGGSVTLDGMHKVKGYSYVEGKEHSFYMVLSRFKISLSLNKTISLPAKNLPTFTSRMCHIQKTVSVKGDQMHVPVPGTQTNRRIGVQTVGEDGLVCHHSSEILKRSSVRNERGKAQNQRVTEVGDMFTAINYWCIPTESRQSNFLRYRPTLVAGLINNFYNMGTAVTAVDEKKRRILRKGKFPWLKLDEILPCMTPEVVEVLFNKANHRLSLIKNEIKQLQDQINVRDVIISDLTSQKSRADDELEKKKDECEQLLDEKYVMERDMRGMKRAYTTLSCQHKELEEKVTKLEDKEKSYDEKQQKLRKDYDTKFQHLFSTLDQMSKQHKSAPSCPERFTEEDSLEANLPKELENIMQSFNQNAAHNDEVDFFSELFQ